MDLFELSKSHLWTSAWEVNVSQFFFFTKLRLTNIGDLMNETSDVDVWFF